MKNMETQKESQQPLHCNKGGLPWYPVRTEVCVLHDPTFLWKSHQVTSHNQLSQRWHIPRAPTPAASWETYSSPALPRRTGIGELQESSSSMVAIYITSVLSHLQLFIFFSEKESFLTFSLTRYAKMLMVNPARKNLGCSKTLLNYHMRSRFREIYCTCS